MNHKTQVKALSVLMALVLAASAAAGCSGPANGGDRKDEVTRLKVPLTIYANYAFYNDAESETEWETYMSDLYGSTVDVVNTEYHTAQAEVMGGRMTGLVSLKNDAIGQAQAAGLLLPLEDYLADNRVWMSLPESYRKCFEKDGHLWAIPWQIQSTTNVTAIRTDWLKKAGKTVPTSTTELLEAGKAFLACDANGDGDKTNDYLSVYPGFTCPDIMNAMGLYINGYSTIAYDPTLDCVADAFFKPEAKEALSFIRECYNAGLISVDYYANGDMEGMYEGKYGTVTGNPVMGYSAALQWLAANDERFKDKKQEELFQSEEFYEAGKGLYENLAPLSDKNPIAITSQSFGYVLTVGTEDPEAVANAFVDMLFGSINSYLECTLGVPDHYTVDGDKEVVMKYKDPETKQQYSRPGLIDYSTVKLDESYQVYLSEEMKVYEKPQQMMMGMYQEYLDRYKATGQLVEISPFNTVYSPTLESNERFIQTEFFRVMTGLLNKDVSIDQLLNEYRTKVRDVYHLQDILDEANKAIGKTGKQVLN